MKEKEALQKAASYLNIESTVYPDFPLARKQEGDAHAEKRNIVLVMMESMTAYKMGLYGNKQNLTPYLDSLAERSICFPNIYSSGIHTHNGLYSTLFSQPAILDRIAIRDGVTANQQYYGFPHVLNEYGYETHFVITGDGKFDFMDSFFPQNGFDHFIDKEFYNPKDMVNIWGVPDHIQFNSTIPFMDKAYEEKQPFFMAYMTISTHAPLAFPEEKVTRKLHAEDLQDRSYEYADWSIEQFMQKAADKPWYNETVFVFIPDHGKTYDEVYEMPLSYHKGPIIIFDPRAEKSDWNEKIGLQIDLFPTVMGYLNLPFENNTLGTNLFEHTRPYAYFTADNKIGVLDSTHFYIRNTDGRKALFDYTTHSLDNIAHRYPEKVRAMEDYAFSMLQTSHELIGKRLVGKPK